MSTGVIGGAVLGVAASGFFPWINGEAVVVGAAMLLPTSGLPTLVLACAVVQMTCKAVLYALVRWAPDRLPRRARAVLSRAERYRERRGLLTAAIVTGSLIALPPFYLVTLACGLLRAPFALFVVAGLAGTISRYGLLAWAVVTLGAG